MKKIVLLIIATISIVGYGYGQTKSELKAKVEDLSAIIESLQDQIHELNQENKNLVMQINEIKQFVNSYPHKTSPSDEQTTAYNSANGSNTNENVTTERQQCAAITKDGTRCLRMAQEGSKYCWQHLEKLKSIPSTDALESSSSSFSSGRVWYTGPRGGQYYINSKGNKVYRKRK